MEKIQSLSRVPELENSEDAHVHFAHSPTRCPYCHDSVDLEGERWVACGDCLARHHDDCHRDHGRCASCDSTKKLISEGSAPAIETTLSAEQQAGILLLVQSLALLFGAFFHMDGQVISGLKWTSSVVLVVTVFLSVLAFYKAREEKLQRALFRMGLTNVISLGIGVQLVFALYLWDVGSPNNPHTWAWLSGFLSLYSAIQGLRIQRRAGRRECSELAQDAKKASEPLETVEKA